MAKRLLLLILLVANFLVLNTSQVRGADSQWKNLVPGLDYREFFLSGPNHLYVVRMDLDNPDLIVDVSLANGSLSGGLEPVMDQAARYDQAVNYWGGSWGKRNRVVAAINGGFFNTDSGLPANGIVQSGWYVKRFEDRQSIGGFAWRLDRLPVIFECLIQRPGLQEIVIEDSLAEIRLDGINNPPAENQVVLYTFHYGKRIEPSDLTSEFVIELEQPLGSGQGFSPTRGTVAGPVPEDNAVLASLNLVVLSASGKMAVELEKKLTPGTPILINQNIRHLDNFCRKERQPGMDNLYSALAGGSIFLRNGRIEPLDDLGSVLRNPRTAVALNDQFLFFIVVDGRDPLRSIGMSMVELAQFSRIYLDARWGVAMDGGGSSSLVLDGELVNFPNSETVVKAQLEKQPRAVATGLMIIQLLPEENSVRYKPGDRVSVMPGSDANLRLGPGTNFLTQALIPAGSTGLVLPDGLNGVLAKGYYWWKISFGDLSGWMSESVLQ